jgi:hypothetical protein
MEVVILKGIAVGAEKWRRGEKVRSPFHIGKNTIAQILTNVK